MTDGAAARNKAAPPPHGIRTGGAWFVRLAYPVLAIGLCLGAWEALVRLHDVPLYILPKPSDFLMRLVAERAAILAQAGATSISIALGFLAAVAFAVPLALAIVSMRGLERGLFPVIVFLNIMPKTVIGPILIVWLGVSQAVAVFIVFLMCFFPILVDSMSGFRATDPRLSYIARSMGATRLQAFRHVRLPAAMGHVFAGMKIGIVKAVEGVVIAEFIGSSAGLGFMIMRASSFMDTTLMFSGLVATALVALAFNATVAAAERILMPWLPPRRA